MTVGGCFSQLSSFLWQAMHTAQTWTPRSVLDITMFVVDVPFVWTVGICLFWKVEVKCNFLKKLTAWKFVLWLLLPLVSSLRSSIFRNQVPLAATSASSLAFSLRPVPLWVLQRDRTLETRIIRRTEYFLSVKKREERKMSLCKKSQLKVIKYETRMRNVNHG